MELEKPKIAIIYDFDKTLSPKNMQEFEYIKKLGVENDEFWNMCDKLTEDNKADRILSYMYLMLKTYKEKGIELTKDSFIECGKNIELFEGVDTWFERMNNYADSVNAELEHFVVSSGLKEMIEATSIAKYFKEIYAGYFMYNKNNEPVWPALAINYTNKTQFIYRINRGILGVNDDSINEPMNKEMRSVPFQNMIYIGDSLTDIPCMRLIMKSGGYAIGVYSNGDDNKEYVSNLVNQNRINYYAEANYSIGSELESLVQEIILSIKLSDNLRQISFKQKNRY